MEEQGALPGNEALCIRSVWFACVCLYVSVDSDMTVTYHLYCALALRILVNMAHLRDSVSAPLPMILHSVDQGHGHIPSPPTTWHVAISGTTGSSVMCCLCLETTVEMWIYSKVLPY